LKTSTNKSHEGVFHFTSQAASRAEKKKNLIAMLFNIFFSPLIRKIYFFGNSLSVGKIVRGCAARLLMAVEGFMDGVIWLCSLYIHIFWYQVLWTLDYMWKKLVEL
jgi:hypothetical protein